jgi:hypothetical protein
VNELEYLRSGLDRIIAGDPALAQELQDTQSQVVSELPSGGGLEGKRPSMDPAALQGALETIVKKKGRPVLTVRQNDFKFEATDVESEVWRDRLKGARDLLKKAIPAVGRVEVANNSDYAWVGTAWLAHDEIAVTNRHVAAEFARAQGNGFVFKTDPAFTSPMTSSLDFLQEAGEPATRVFKVTKVLYIEPEPGPDMAFLQVDRGSGSDRLSDPIPIATRPPQADDFVAAIGYPARDSRVPDHALVARVFGDIYDKKRLAPGQLRAVEVRLVTHDASTLGGNSGSVLVDLKTGEAVGLHRAGLYLQDNFAVPIAVVRERLKKIKEGGTRTTSSAGGTRSRASTKPENQAVTNVAGGAVTQVAGGAITLTIPLNITVQLGQPAIPGTPPAAPAPDSAEAVAAAADELQTMLEGRPGVVAVRAGYRFEGGWITDDRAVVVATSGAVTNVPAEVNGVPVEVVPASPWDLVAQAREAVEALEKVPVTHYKPPSHVKLKEVNEEMRVVCHLSPDAGWPTLRKFLEAKTSRLTIGIFDFTAPHIIDAVKAAVKTSPRRLNMVIQHGASMGGDSKKDDIPDEQVVEDFENTLKSRFKQAWASVSGPNRLFASSYHIKVIVRDGQAFWLSSGNCQSSNQPDIDPAGDGETTFGPLRGFNREWHAVVENPTLADQYEKFLLWDLEQASALKEETAEALAVEGPAVLVPVELFAQEAPEPEARAKAQYFEPLEVNRKVRVRPLLTPDNYQPEVLKLIKGAKKSILFQNQSLNLLADNEPGFKALVTALRDKQQELDDVRIIIRGDFNPRPVLEKLKDFGFDMSKVRAQKKCHTKGIVVDSDRVVLGSHNWTNQGALVNRDASLIFFDPEIAEYYERAFEFDWENMAKAQLDDELPPLELAEPGAEVPEGMVKVSLEELLFGDG